MISFATISGKVKPSPSVFGWHYDTSTRDDLYECRGGDGTAKPRLAGRTHRLPVARHQGHVAAGRIAAHASAHGARLDAFRQGRPPHHGRDAVRGSNPGEGSGIAGDRLQHTAPVHR